MLLTTLSSFLQKWMFNYTTDNPPGLLTTVQNALERWLVFFSDVIFLLSRIPLFRQHEQFETPRQSYLAPIILDKIKEVSLDMEAMLGSYTSKVSPRGL
ncbi:hypothetical protein AVEN_262544-1 [Araneus ventricosus]|uniref:Uncharacterized protein n=1 Tax=Araneus ventricosus TaxID=182803 RepID=A0A4Y2KUM1_ARAVE|nr:hypothetical protein AVEN_262544-1 [Araneus ventricosus]